MPYDCLHFCLDVVSIHAQKEYVESQRRKRDSSSPVLSLRCSIYRADGTTSFSVPVPDTITTWVASAFAVNPASGLGLTPSPANVSRSCINLSPKTDSLLLN